MRSVPESGVDRWHRLAWLLLVSLLIVGWPWLETLSTATRAALLAALVAVFGLPHGAMDPLVARAAGLWHDARQLAVHLAAYIGLASAVIFMWWLLPVTSLTAFLFMSAWHFGDDWPRLPGNRSTHVIERLLAGLGVVGAPILFHPDRAAELFALLTLHSDTSQAIALLVMLWRVMAVAGIAGLAWLALIQGPRRPAAMLEPVMLIVAAAWLPPLVYFAIYFCFLHSPRHLINVARDPRVHLSPAAGGVIVGLTLLTVMIGLTAFFILGDSQPAETRVLQVVFVSLAALTVPHMLLVERFAHGETTS